jgi:hypothetical protein
MQLPHGRYNPQHVWLTTAWSHTHNPLGATVSCGHLLRHLQHLYTVFEIRLTEKKYTGSNLKNTGAGASKCVAEARINRRTEVRSCRSNTADVVAVLNLKQHCAWH